MPCCCTQAALSPGVLLRALLAKPSTTQTRQHATGRAVWHLIISPCCCPLLAAAITNCSVYGKALGPFGAADIEEAVGFGVSGSGDLVRGSRPACCVLRLLRVHLRPM